MNIGVSGHQKIPREAIRFIVEGVTDVLNRASVGVTGVSSLAVGADQLFAQRVLQLGGQLHVVLPCANYESTFTQENDLAKFRELLHTAVVVERLTEPQPSEAAFLRAGQRVVDLSGLLIAVWDGKPSRGKGGTADIVAYARQQKVPVEIVWPVGVSR